jgi:hypothetical protein
MTPEKETVARRTISLPLAQDRFVAELIGADGNFSGLVQTLIAGVQDGRIPKGVVTGGQSAGVAERARAYLRAKEAGLLFEEDVAAFLIRWLSGRRGLSVSRSRIHNSGGSAFIADFSIERPKGDGEVVASVVCKSSPRADKLQLALAEAIIGSTKTTRPVITVVPYVLDESAPVVALFAATGHRVCTLAELPKALESVMTQ